ncbi:hypothetical protein H5410_031440, partial [Solanum commersonii]
MLHISNLFTLRKWQGLDPVPQRARIYLLLKPQFMGELGEVMELTVMSKLVGKHLPETEDGRPTQPPLFPDIALMLQDFIIRSDYLSSILLVENQRGCISQSLLDKSICLGGYIGRREGY